MKESLKMLRLVFMIRCTHNRDRIIMYIRQQRPFKDRSSLHWLFSCFLCHFCSTRVCSDYAIDVFIYEDNGKTMKLVEFYIVDIYGIFRILTYSSGTKMT